MGRELHGQEGQQQQSSAFEQTYGGDLFALWSESLGDHCHHGYYENHLQLDGNGTLNEDSFALAREAAVRLIDKLLLWANIPADGGGHGPQKILDVGMGLGAASRYFGKRFPHATVQGISLAKVEVEIATKLTASQNLSDKVSFLYADARTLPFPNNEYDLVWCLECADHILEREQLMKELARVTAPGGKIVLTTMCNRELLPHEKSLSESEKEVLENIFSDDLAVASWSQPSLYLRLAEENGLEAIQSDNWTKYVTPGVPIWIHFYKNSDLSIVGVKTFSMALPALMKAYEQGLVEYFVFKVSFLYADARTLPFPNNEYDLVWCLECADHILEREQLMKELARVTAPGGKIVLTTMCNRELLPHEKSLSESEKEVLENIFSDDLAVASWSQPSLYLRLAEENGLEAIQSDNWTKYVTPGVPIWIHFYKNSDLSIVGVKAFSMALPALMKAYEQGLVEYFVFKAVKPSS